MSWYWLAWAGAPDPGGACAWATATDDAGEVAGVLAAWPSGTERPNGGVKVDARAIDPDGEAVDVSWVLAPDGMGVPFDDPAVGHAIRRVLALPPADVLSTFLVGDAHFVGAVTGVRGGDRGRLLDDPFGRVFPARRLRVGPGLLGTMDPPTGPVGQRYGSDQPWPWDRFS